MADQIPPPEELKVFWKAAKRSLLMALVIVPLLILAWFFQDRLQPLLAILRDPDHPVDADYLLVESTYGNREHEPLENVNERVCAIINRAVERNGKIYVAPFTVAGDSFRADKPQVWTSTVVRPLGTQYPYDIHPDGKRLAAIANVEQSNATIDKVVFVFNFFDYLKTTVPAGKR